MPTTIPCAGPADAPERDRKLKQSPQHKRARRLAAQRVPSVLAASTMTLAHRHAAGAAPANDLERAAQALLARADPLVLQALRSAADGLDAMPAQERDVLFDAAFAPGRPVSPDTLARRLGREYGQRASLAAAIDASQQEVLETSSVAHFAIVAEELQCVRETAPASAGADEVGLRFLAMPLLADLSTGELHVTSRRYGNLDAGERRRIDRTVFESRAPMLGVALAVLGHELDGEDACQNRVSALIHLVADLVQAQLRFAGHALKAAGYGPEDLARPGSVPCLVEGIGSALSLALDRVACLWAPADLIIEDPTGYTVPDLVARTSVDAFERRVRRFRTEGGIDVQAEPLQKAAPPYRERRTYDSADEQSRYRIVYRLERRA